MTARIDRIDNAAECLATLPVKDLEILHLALCRLQSYHAALWDGEEFNTVPKDEYVGTRMMFHAIVQALEEAKKREREMQLR